MVACLLLPWFVIEAEVRRRPELAGRPVGVHARGRLEALSREAEAAGLRVGQAAGQAGAICPDAVLLPYDANLYAALQEQVLARCADYVPAIEPASLTDLFLDLSRTPLAVEVMRDTAATVEGLGFTCRWGLGPNKLVAKIAARERSGTVVAEGEARAFLARLPLARLWPLEDKVITHLEDLGLTMIGLLQRVPAAMLARHFGTRAKQLIELAQGTDRAPLHASYPPAALEARAVLPEAEDRTAVEAALRELAARVAVELEARHQTCRRIALRLETETRTFARQRTLLHPTAEAAEVLLAAEHLLATAETKEPITALRLRAEELSRRAEVQLSLLEDREAEGARDGLAAAVARIRREFGEGGARWAGEWERPRRERVLACWEAGR